MRIEAAVLTHPGGRSHNEDAVYCNTLFLGDELLVPIGVNFDMEPPFFAAVADGMGGYGNGDFASQAVLKFLVAAKPEDIDAWTNQTLLAHQWLMAQARENPRLGPCGTTLAALAFSRTELLAVNIGDSAIYRSGGAYLTLVSTTDRSEQDRVSPVDPLTPACNILRQAIGGPSGRKEPLAHVRSIPATPGRYFLCTDGVTDTLSLDEIEHALCSNDTPAAAAERLFLQLIGQESSDNFSFIIIDLNSMHSP